MDAAELRGRVDELASEPDRLPRRLVALGALTARLAPLSIEPILVGGCALELYTEGGYSTGDVDLALAHTPASGWTGTTCAIGPPRTQARRGRRRS